ncbi:hypothetical protein BWQ96_01463 [Gracilariopsis chorda]|uniref:NAD(P)-binding domain-containing protein n=1 Tax=Gracilariopsis chorda TaxID=448386 RepID=A0A2V3J2D1_9FLOR|nr:hypothetical protein BWQ96_01463 [Gracilariopsis chorda]|eukprot:PXF48611.1 hypothetical protein BWQ96_01463 [Gracilariopsis chorda]
MSEQAPPSTTQHSASTTTPPASPHHARQTSLIAVVCGAHTQLGKFVLRELLRSPNVHEIHAFAEFDPRSELRLSPAHAHRLRLHIDSLDYLERNIATYVKQCHLAFCTIGLRYKPPDMNRYKFYNYNVSLPKRFLTIMFRMNVDRIALFSTKKASSRTSSVAMQRSTTSADNFARQLQVEQRESMSENPVPGISIFKVPLLLTDLMDQQGVKGTAISPFDQIREKVVFKLGIGASNAVHVRDVAKAMVADALEKLDLQNERPDLAFIFKSRQTAFDELYPADIINLANDTRDAQRSHFIEMRKRRSAPPNIPINAPRQSNDQVSEKKYTPSELSQSAVPSALPSNAPTSPSAVPSAAHSPSPTHQLQQTEIEGLTAPQVGASPQHAILHSHHSVSQSNSHPEHSKQHDHLTSFTHFPLPSSDKAHVEDSHQLSQAKEAAPLTMPGLVLQSPKKPSTSPTPSSAARRASHNNDSPEASETRRPQQPALTSTVEALGNQLGHRLTIVHDNERLPGTSTSPRPTSRRSSAKDFHTGTENGSAKVSQRKSTPQLRKKYSTQSSRIPNSKSPNSKSPKNKSPNSKSRSSRSPPQHPFESDDAQPPVGRYSDAQSLRSRPSRSSQQRYSGGRSMPTTSFYSSGYHPEEGVRRRSEVDSIRHSRSLHRKRSVSVPSASAIMSQISLIANRILEATDRPSVKRYQQAYDPNYLPRSDPRLRHAKDRRTTDATAI